MVFGNTDRDHVFLNVLAEVNPAIEASGDDIEAAVVSCDFQNDIGIIARKSGEFRPRIIVPASRGMGSLTRPAGLSRRPESWLRAS